MKHRYLTAVWTFMCLAAGAAALGQSSEAVVSGSATPQAGVPIEQLVAIVSKKTGKRFVLDPRVRADVLLVGTSPSDLSYSEFLTVLEVYGFGTVEDGKLVRIVPDANMRQYPVPTITAKDTLPGAEFVTEILTVKNVSAGQLIPILRPMIKQYGHLAVYPGSNTLILSDRFDNVRRIEGLIRTIDATKPSATNNPEAAPAPHPSGE